MWDTLKGKTKLAVFPRLLYEVAREKAALTKWWEGKLWTPRPQCYLILKVLLPSGRLHSPWTQTLPRLKEAFLYPTGFLTTQMRLTLDWSLGKLTARVHELEAGSNVLLCSHSSGRPLFSQVTFKSFVAPEALHSRVTLHQSGVMDADPIRIWGEGTGSGIGGNKRIKLHRCGKHYMPQFNVYYLIVAKACKEAL